MRIFLLMVVAVFVLVSCKGEDGADGSISITLESSAAFKASSFAIGCYVESGSNVSCLCYESGTIYTGTATDSTYCTYMASDVDLVAESTTLTSQTAGAHYTCMTTDITTDFDTFCDDGDSNTTAIGLTANAGTAGTNGAAGEVGTLKEYLLTFIASGITLD
ncbi:MAG: hypothetical protein QNL04_08265 [SAR324 cluster bacterium]|nr:hypothetical protein [SAR324 cluster bacterium]